MTAKSVLARLESLGDERMRAQNTRQGAGENQYGVRLGDIRKVAKEIKADHDLAMALWGSGVLEGQFMTTLLVKPKALSIEEMDQMVRAIDFVRVADWFVAYVAKKHPEKERLCAMWMESEDIWAARAGWALTAERVAKGMPGMDPGALLDRLQSEMGQAAPEVQWTMNFTLVEIGIQFQDHRKRAIALGESLGIYRDYPASKGCTSPFAPIWIEAMVSRQA